MEVIVVLPKGQIAIGKLLQALVAGARVVAIDGNFDQALAIVRALAEQDDHPVTLVNSVNPFRLDGQKTGAFEICDELGRAPDVLAIPVGNAGNISAYWAGFREYARGRASPRPPPRMWGFQAAGAAPIVNGHRVDHPETVATAIRIGDPASWTLAVEARDASGGRIAAVTDDEILAAYRDLARLEGIFCEPASAAGGRRGPRGGRWPATSTRTRSWWRSSPATGSRTRPRPSARWRRSSRPRRPWARSPWRWAGRRWSRTGSPSSTAARSRSRCRPRRPTSAPATTASASRSRSPTGSSSRSAAGAVARSS